MALKIIDDMTEKEKEMVANMTDEEVERLATEDTKNYFRILGNKGHVVTPEEVIMYYNNVKRSYQRTISACQKIVNGDIKEDGRSLPSHVI